MGLLHSIVRPYAILFFPCHMGRRTARLYVLSYTTLVLQTIPWMPTPQSILEKFLYYTTAWHRITPIVFTFLFVLVCERQLADLGMEETSHGVQSEKIKEWCRFSMHEHWKLDMVVEDTMFGMDKKIALFPVECEFMHGLYGQDHELTAEERLSNRRENDRKFLEISCAILNDDATAVLSAFTGFCSGVDDLNYCLGATLLGVAIKWGTLSRYVEALASINKARSSEASVHLHPPCCCPAA